MPSDEGKGTRNAGSSSLKGMRVLLVEDGWQVADAVKVTLEKMQGDSKYRIAQRLTRGANQIL